MEAIGVVSAVTRNFDLEVEWRIDNLCSVLSRGIGSSVYESPPFYFDNQLWNLGISSNGATRFIGNIDLGLRKKSLGDPAHLEFSIAFKTLNGEKDLERNCKRLFGSYDKHVFLHFISKGELAKRESELFPAGILTVMCTMKNLKSIESSKNLIEEGNSETILAEPSSKLQVKRKSATENVSGSLTAPECSYRPKIFKAGIYPRMIKIHLPKEKGWNESSKCSRFSTVIPSINYQAGQAKGTVNTPGASALPKRSKILEDMKQMFLKQENCDVVFRVQGQDFPAHKAIVAARCPALASTFKNGVKKEGSEIVDIEDCENSVFSYFLCYIYCEDTENLSQENAIGLFTAAHKYEMPDLMAKCIEFMKESLSVDTFCEIISLAFKYSLTELTDLANDFFVKNAEEILVTAKWRTFATENPAQSNQLFIQYVTSVRHSNM